MEYNERKFVIYVGKMYRIAMRQYENMASGISTKIKAFMLPSDGYSFMKIKENVYLFPR